MAAGVTLRLRSPIPNSNIVYSGLPHIWPHVLIGTPDQIADDLLRRREEYGISYVVINTGVEEHREQVAPVVARLAGT